VSAFLPGEIGLGHLRKSLASLLPDDGRGAAARRSSATLIDAEDVHASTGRLVGNPVGIYTNFLIEVDRSRYTVTLYGVRDEDERTVLFECRAGLGSSEYPTPKGSFYLLRIFDDHPLWIPPPDRDWAWGQAPSHSVYGGHMMPFFTKRLSKGGEERDGEVIEDLDLVASKVQMIDAEAYRIHGTDSPWSIGGNQSHGCVRLLNKTVKGLAETLKM
jgi:L,D-transpeptidase ErfK/SrfK